ncbi:MAG: isoaspartyl peptidase/L-asparaginase [Gemmatimonadota bacterium]
MSGPSPLRVRTGVVIHGGVGTLPRHRMTPELQTAYERTLTESLEAGHAALDRGGSAVDAVVAAVRVMEDSALFNAGRGSNYDEHGVVTMDASLMRSDRLDAGAVAGVTRVRHPIELARLVMERSRHLMLIGEGAEAFAWQQGVEPARASWFDTERRWDELVRARTRAAGGRPNVLGDADPAEVDGNAWDAVASRSGTVGAVALDARGELAAATSTGGMANKTWGRVGDTPIVGAGTYAGPRCAVSCTGWGEYFIRNAVAYDVHARMAYGAASLAEATQAVIWETLERQVPGSGGLVAIDGAGNVELCFNTPGMYRGWVDQDGRISVAIYREDS